MGRNIYIYHIISIFGQSIFRDKNIFQPSLQKMLFCKNYLLFILFSFTSLGPSSLYENFIPRVKYRPLTQWGVEHSTSQSDALSHHASSFQYAPTVGMSLFTHSHHWKPKIVLIKKNCYVMIK